MDQALLQPLLDAGIIDDPWLEGTPRCEDVPVVLSLVDANRVAEAACAVAMMLDEAVQLAAHDAALLTALGLDPTLSAIARMDAPRWLGLARADVFLCDDSGPAQVCELNCDTPTGLAECCELGRIAATQHPHLRDPSAQLPTRWIDMVRAAVPDRNTPRPVVGIVDPTDMTEDLGHVRLLTRWLESAGCAVIRGSPFNLHAVTGRRVGLFGTPCDVLIRHYKTDWWAQRRPVWRDEPEVPDSRMLVRELALIAEAMQAGTVTVLNPWGATIGQNKRTLALPWEQPESFSLDTLTTVNRHLPESRWLESVPRERLIAEQHDWILKSDYGCEGDEVFIGADTKPAEWRTVLERVIPERWMVQRRFVPQSDANGRHTNHGVYMVGGMPSGIFSRRSARSTDRTALACATLVQPP